MKLKLIDQNEGEKLILQNNKEHARQHQTMTKPVSNNGSPYRSNFDNTVNSYKRYR